MTVTLHALCGFQLGFELAENQVNDELISYLLIDLGILRIQCAWYRS